MSMNLHCEEVELWQTPTHISYMCYSNNNGGWRGILYRYEQWVQSLLNGVFTEDELERRDELKESIKEHIKELHSFKRLRFSVW